MDAALTPKEVILRYYDLVWDRRQPEAIETLFAPEYVNHAGARGTLAGPAGITKNYHSLITAFPDVRFTLDDVLVDGDKVVVRYTMLGIHQGEFQGRPPTGRAVNVPGIGIYRVAGGLIRESWVLRDSLVLLRQIEATG
ncbi:ester cyclase [Chelatococcus sp. GCM10030263]|uniref:ester cyclase n=1 Tax=Chelatococcus sp. GCM10030263 TaxID=3273387 RepID=UPI00361A98D0